MTSNRLKLRHRVFMWFYDKGYIIWLKIGRVMCWEDVMLVKELNGDYFDEKIAKWSDDKE